MSKTVMDLGVLNHEDRWEVEISISYVKHNLVVLKLNWLDF